MTQLRKTSFLVISGERRVNDFMAAFDLRDKSKVFVSIRNVTFSSKLSDEAMFNSFRDALKSEYNLVYLLCQSQPDLVYRNNDVKVISDGSNWVMLDDYLSLYGYPESMVIDAVGCRTL